MNIGFYAPLKAPDHPVPSGDREMARNLIEVMTGLGHNVELLCRLRSYDRNGDMARQERLRRLGERAARRIVNHHQPLDIFFTYHAYYKAPDWIGPHVVDELGIPYIIAEASIANKRADGPWSIGHEATVDAVRLASHVLAITTVDRESIAQCRGDRPGLSLLPPFIPTVGVSSSSPKSHEPPRLLTVAMMRSDVKLQSYKFLAAALRLLADKQWELIIVGDGPEAGTIRSAFSEFGDRVSFIGQVGKDQLSEVYRTADIFVWPGLNEAYGLVFLEAQSQGLPVIAVRNGGVADVVRDGHSGILCAKPEKHAFAQAIGELLTDVDRREHMGQTAVTYVKQHHSFAMASKRLDCVLQEFASS